jgi:hypothetical protein
MVDRAIFALLYPVCPVWFWMDRGIIRSLQLDFPGLGPAPEVTECYMARAAFSLSFVAVFLYNYTTVLP